MAQGPSPYVSLKPSERDLDFVARRAGDNWRSLLTHLGIEFAEIQRFFSKNSNDSKGACFEGLVSWLSSEVHDPEEPVTFGTLFQALREASMAACVSLLEKKLEARMHRSAHKPTGGDLSAQPGTSTPNERRPAMGNSTSKDHNTAENQPTMPPSPTPVEDQRALALREYTHRMFPVQVLTVLYAMLAGSEAIAGAGATACDPGLPLPRDCAEVYQRGCTQEGLYTIDPCCPNNNKPFQVYCSNRYTVIQRRMDGSENFNQDWAPYVAGFGKKCGEHWLGLEKIHCLTTRTARAELRIDMADFRADKKYAHYSFFMVGNAATNYKLQIAGYTGTAGDSMIASYNLNGIPFSTHDRDNDNHNSLDCVQHHGGGGWWFNQCTNAHLNGPYYHDTTPYNARCVYWYSMTGLRRSLKFAEMKIRARD